MNVGRFAMHNVRVVITAVLLIALIGLGAGNYAFGSAAGAPSDLVGHWAEPQLEQWLKDGLLTGYPDGRVEPDRLLTRAEWMALANRAQGYSATSDIAFSDLSPSAWEYEDARKAVKAGYIIGYGDGTIRSGSSISRQEAAVMLVRMFGLDSKADGAAASRFTDTASIAGWSRAAVSALVGGNLIAGYPDGTFKPKAFVTRAEAVVMLDNAMKTLHSAAPAVYDKPGIYGSVNEMTALEGDVVINAAGVTLQNMNIKGKLILAEGIGEGDVVLNHVTVQGDTRVQGGGEHSIHIADSVMARIIIDKKTGTVRIVVEGSTSAAAVDIQSPAVLEEAAGLSGAGFTAVSLANALPAHSAVTLKGKFDSVTIASSQIEVSVPQGSIDQLTAGSQAQGLSLNVGTDAKIVSMVLDAIVKVLGQGMIEKATLSEHAKGTSFEKQPVQTVDTSSQAPA
ncbi:S-layer homology domain-containing protein, partial [Paenibacillus sepulcri]|nr:S-layer homology domain-containing protein [Paenibacillus sepulcri]